MGAHEEKPSFSSPIELSSIRPTSSASTVSSTFEVSHYPGVKVSEPLTIPSAAMLHKVTIWHGGNRIDERGGGGGTGGGEEQENRRIGDGDGNAPVLALESGPADLL